MTMFRLIVAGFVSGAAGGMLYAHSNLMDGTTDSVVRALVGAVIFGLIGAGVGVAVWVLMGPGRDR
jgi:hypothetical protein